MWNSCGMKSDFTTKKSFFHGYQLLLSLAIRLKTFALRKPCATTSFVAVEMEEDSKLIEIIFLSIYRDRQWTRVTSKVEFPKEKAQSRKMINSCDYLNKWDSVTSVSFTWTIDGNKIDNHCENDEEVTYTNPRMFQSFGSCYTFVGINRKHLID